MLQAKFSAPVNPLRPFQFKRPRVLLALPVMFCLAAASLPTLAQTPGQILVFPTSIQWNKRSGVIWYRVQIGGDETFRNIFYDKRVFSGRYTVSNLPPGYYYWRIASADNQLGAFSRPVRFFVSGGVVTSFEISRQPTRPSLDQATALSRPGQRR